VGGQRPQGGTVRPEAFGCVAFKEKKEAKINEVEEEESAVSYKEGYVVGVASMAQLRGGGQEFDQRVHGVVCFRLLVCFLMLCEIVVCRTSLARDASFYRTTVIVSNIAWILCWMRSLLPRGVNITSAASYGKVPGPDLRCSLNTDNMMTKKVWSLYFTH